MKVRLGLLTLLACVAGSGPGCFPTDNGPEPPARELYFPTGLSISPGGKALYVANSDFDLQYKAGTVQYKAGTVQVIDLERVRAMIPHVWNLRESGTSVADACLPLGLNAPLQQLLYPGACAAIDMAHPTDGGGSLVVNTVKIGAFASDMTLVLPPTPPQDPDNPPPARLMVPVRGDPSLTWFDVSDDRHEPTESESLAGWPFLLDCNQAGNDGRCGDSHRAGTNPAESTRNITLPGEPFSVAASDAGEAVVVTHQTSGAASLFLHGWKDVSPAGAGTDPRINCYPKLPEKPELSFVLGGLPTGVTGVAAFPMPRLAREFGGEYPYSPGFLVAFRNAAEIDVLRFYDDCASAPSRAFLVRAGAAGINTNAAGFDSRSIVIDGRSRRTTEQSCVDDRGACSGSEAECLDTYKGCLKQAAAFPVKVFVANRLPPTLLVGQTYSAVSTYGTDDRVWFYDQIPLSQGVSRVYMGTIIDKDGNRKPRLFALCFDARTLFVIDPEAGTKNYVERNVLLGRGPSAMAFDPGIEVDDARALAYVAHFTDSYIGVLDLDMRHDTYLSLVAMVGTPRPPRESK
jgi:hypothetical protein